MNDHHLEKVDSIKETLPEVEGYPLSELTEMIGGDETEEDDKIVPRPVSPEEVLKTANKMKRSRYMGNDDIPADLFLLALPSMLPAVTHIMNLSIRESKFPDLWKVSKITPLFKGGGEDDRYEPRMYRPMALLPVCARLLEKLVCDQVMDHLYRKELLHSHNHGYWKFHGTVSAVLEAQEKVMEAMEGGDIIGMVTLDQSSAFNVIEHRILKTKMKSYLFSEKSLNWFLSYLESRSQYVALQSSSSSVKSIGP